MDTENVSQGSVKLLEYKPEPTAMEVVIADHTNLAAAAGEAVYANPDAGQVSLVDIYALLQDVKRTTAVLLQNDIERALVSKRQVRGALA